MSDDPNRRRGTADVVGGLLATFAIVLAALELFYRPFRMAPIAALLVLISAAMRREQRIVGFAVGMIVICFVIGAGLQVYTKHPLF